MSSGSGGPHGSNCVVNGELVVHEDGLWLVAPRSPGVYLLEQVAVEGRRFSRKESIEEGEVPAVREEAMDCEELMEEIRCGFEGTVDYPMLRIGHMICVLRSPPKEISTSPFVPSRVPEHHWFVVGREDVVCRNGERFQISRVRRVSVSCFSASLYHSVEG